VVAVRVLQVVLELRVLLTQVAVVVEASQAHRVLRVAQAGQASSSFPTLAHNVVLAAQLHLQVDLQSIHLHLQALITLN
jgi:hypothetical protein